MSVISTLWEYANGFEKEYRCALDIYLITVLLSSYGITMYCAIYSPDRGHNAVDGPNETENLYLKEQMECIGKLASN